MCQKTCVPSAHLAPCSVHVQGHHIPSNENSKERPFQMPKITPASAPPAARKLRRSWSATCPTCPHAAADTAAAVLHSKITRPLPLQISLSVGPPSSRGTSADTITITMKQSPTSRHIQAGARIASAPSAARSTEATLKLPSACLMRAGVAGAHSGANCSPPLPPFAT